MSEFEIVPGYFGPHVKGKLAGQRKAREYSVQPTSDDRIIVQADGCIGIFDVHNGKGYFNTKGGYFLHLNAMLGAKPYAFPAEFVRLCLEASPALDSTVTRGGVTVHTTVKMLGD